MTNQQKSVNELVSQMLQKRVYAVFSTLVKPVSEMKRLLPDHLQFMINLEKSGVLFASGPYFDEGGRLQGDGLTILRANSLAEAKAIAAQDPFHASGVRTAEIRGWQINEGAYTVRIAYSDQSYTIE